MEYALALLIIIILIIIFIPSNSGDEETEEEDISTYHPGLVIRLKDVTKLQEGTMCLPAHDRNKPWRCPDIKDTKWVKFINSYPDFTLDKAYEVLDSNKLGFKIIDDNNETHWIIKRNFVKCPQPKEGTMKVICITQYYDNLTYGNIYEGTVHNNKYYRLQDDSGNFKNYAIEYFVQPLTPLQYWAETLNGLEENDRFTLELNDQLGQGEKYIYKDNNIKEYSGKSLFSLDWEKQGYILLENLVAKKLPKTRTITIDNKSIEISEESYRALQESLKED